MTTEPLSAGRRFSLSDSSKTWLVTEGTIDLYLADLRNSSPHSSLDYIGTLEAGEILIGIGELSKDSVTTTIVAQSATSAQLEPLLFSSLRAKQIDRWITTVSRFCMPGLAPPLSRQIEAGETIETGDSAVALIGTRNVVWINGGLQPFSIFNPADDSRRLHLQSVPVCRYLWVFAGPRETLSTSTTAEQLLSTEGADRLTSDLVDFHQALLFHLSARRRKGTVAEAERLRETVRHNSRVFKSALHELITPFEPINPTTGLGRTTRFVGALNACRAVGHVLGIPITAPDTEVPDENAEQALMRIATASGVRYRQVLLGEGWWKQDHGPMVGFNLNGISAVVFLRQGTSKYSVFDPLANTQTVVTEELSKSFDAHAYVLYRPFPSDRGLRARDLLYFGLRNSRIDLMTIFGIGVLIGILSLAMPIATGVLFDQIIPEGQRGALLQLSILLFSASVAIFLVRLGQSFATQRLEGRMESELQTALWDRLLNLRAGFFRKYTAGDLAWRSLAINQMRQVLTGSAVSAVLMGVFSIFNFALLFSYSVKLALLATELAAVAVAFVVASTWATMRLNRKTMAMEGRIAGRVAQLLLGVAKFRVSGAEPRAFGRWAEDYSWQTRMTLKTSRIAIGMSIFNSVFPIATSILIYITTATMMKEDPKFTTGHFLAFNAAFLQFLGSTTALSAAVLSIIGVVPMYERAKPILNELPEKRIDLRKPGQLQGGIELSHISFRYREDLPMVLSDISFSIKAGQYIAIVGESGSGKSTLMRLLLGFETPLSGSIFYDGRDLAELDKQAVRTQIGVVLQSGVLMTGDILTNIVGNSTLSLDWAWDAAKRVGLDDEIRAMPMGMHTLINESGSGLSGGQRQRILIARAILHRPRILFFDEATSALDNRTQAIVSQSLDAMQATRIVIAHRLSTILRADVIMVFKEGRLHETGTYADLMTKEGYFSELAKRQLL